MFILHRTVTQKCLLSVESSTKDRSALSFLQVGAVIATVKARSTTPLIYSIIPGFTNSTNRPVVFSIDETGQLRLMRHLDREKTPLYTFFVRAQTKTSPPLMDHMEVTIQVIILDCDIMCNY